VNIVYRLRGLRLSNSHALPDLVALLLAHVEEIIALLRLYPEFPANSKRLDEDRLMS
jgi:hypothetical protein